MLKKIFPGLTVFFYSLSKLTVLNCYVSSVFRFFKINVYYYFDVYPQTSWNYRQTVFRQIAMFFSVKYVPLHRPKQQWDAKKKSFGICKVTNATPRSVALSYLFLHSYFDSDWLVWSNVPRSKINCHLIENYKKSYSLCHLED
jgi:hypothetical protein